MGSCTASRKFNLSESCSYDCIRNKKNFFKVVTDGFSIVEKKICRNIRNYSHLNELQQCGYGVSSEM